MIRSRSTHRAKGRATSRGQIAVLFGLSIVVFVALCAIVVDMAFYWVSTLQAQRAADAAALAGAVYLPGDTASAYAEAKDSATQNGYTVGVVPIQDSQAVAGGDPRQLDVTINATVPTFFARVVGISSFPVSRSSKGVYVLPVPMGSPQAYYGVGDYSVNKTTTNTTPYTQASVPGYTSTTPTTWTNPNNAWTTASSFATSTTNNQVQAWQALNIPAISGATIDGFVVSFNAKVNTGTACQVKAEVSWDTGTTWNNISPALTTAALTSTADPYQLGSATSLAAWGTNHASWTAADFTNAKFRVRLTYLKGVGCGTLSVNSLAVTVSSHTTTSTTALTTTAGVSDGATFLPSQGGWGAILTRGGEEQNGDAYSPANNTGFNPTNNQKFDANGYHYLVKLPSGGAVKIFDPGFCAMGSNGAAGSLGAGDHWIGTSGNPVSTYYSVWDTNGKPGLPGSWDLLYTSGSMFEDQKGYDPNNMAPGGGGTAPGGATAGCDANHLSWWTVPTALTGGTYVVQVQTSKTNPPNGSADTSVNGGTNAENMWSIEAVGASAQVYGNGRMAVYNNLQVGNAYQLFYLAQIDEPTGAGKTAQIDIFDAGDVAGNATLKILSPDNNTQSLATFSYTTDGNCVVNNSDACSGSNRTQIQTASGGKSSFNNTWIHITIPLPSTYGDNGLWQGGWWQIRYEVPGGGNDTTTWQVSVSGNPVHLLVP